MSERKKKSLLVRCLKGILIGAAIGLIAGLIIGFNDIEISISTYIIAFMIIGFCAILFSVLFFANPVRYIAKGQVDKALGILKGQAEKYSDRTRLCNTIYYNIAHCYNMKGDFDESVAYLKRIDSNKIDKNLQSAYYMLFAANLIFLEGDIELVEEYILKSKEIKALPGLVLMEAYIEASKSNYRKTECLIEGFKMQQQSSLIMGFFNMLYINKKLESITDYYLIGITYLRMNEIEKAKSCFAEVAKYDLEFYYTRKAKEIYFSLQANPTDI